MVIPTNELDRGLNSIKLSKARSRWETVPWDQLGEKVKQLINKPPNTRLSSTASSNRS